MKASHSRRTLPASARGLSCAPVPFRESCPSCCFWPALPAAAAGPPPAKKTLAFESKALDISVQYPQTGNKVLDAVLAGYARKQVADFKTFEPDLVAGEHQYTLDVTYNVERNDGQMFGVLFTEFADTGGVHPNIDFAAFDFVLPSGEQVFLPEIVDGQRGLKRVSDLAIAELVRTIGGPDSVNPTEDIASGAGPDALSLKYFLWLPKTLHIHFPPYQVASYAAGPQEVSIPLSALKGYIRADWRAPQPSFDCKKAATPVEHALCADLALSRPRPRRRGPLSHQASLFGRRRKRPAPPGPARLARCTGQGLHRRRSRALLDQALSRSSRRAEQGARLMRLSRRDILGGAAAFAAAPLVARAAPAADLDVAIVGGGVAGVYAAWRLRQEQPHLRLRLFESSDRIGGRLHSVAFPQAPHLVAEAGGMRFLEAHTHVFSLVNALGLPSRGYPIDEPANRLMLRGRNFPLSDVTAGRARFPFSVPDVDQTPQADYLLRAIAKVVPDAAHMTPADWLKRRSAYRYRNRLLRDWKGHDLLLEGMTPEELALATDASGYDDWTSGESGLDELDYFFVHDDESKPYRTIAGGYQRLPLTLAAEGGEARRRHRGADASRQPRAGRARLSSRAARRRGPADRAHRRARDPRPAAPRAGAHRGLSGSAHRPPLREPHRLRHLDPGLQEPAALQASLVARARHRRGPLDHRHAGAAILLSGFGGPRACRARTRAAMAC